MSDSMPPQMRTAILHPLYDALSAIGCRDEEMAAQLSLPKEQLRDAVMLLPANRIYLFMTWAAERSGDRFFSLNCGRRMGRGFWAPIVSLLKVSRTLGEFLQKFSAMASQNGASASYRLEVEGVVALWRMSRPKGAVPESSQADAIAAGFFCEILKQAVGKDWNPDDIVLVLSDAGLVYSDFLPSSSVIGGAEGVSLRFPSDMLNLALAPLPEAPLPGPILPILRNEISLAEKVGVLLAANLSNPDFGVDEIARLLGLKPWRLQVFLREENTSITELKNRTRREMAIQRLRESEDPIGVIADNLGYANRANFTRAVRGWTGMSPQAFRAENHK